MKCTLLKKKGIDKHKKMEMMALSISLEAPEKYGQQQFHRNMSIFINKAMPIW